MPTAERPPSPWYTREEAAAYLKITARSVDRYVRERKLRKHVRAGVPGSPLFHRDDLDALMTPAAPGT